MRAAIAHERVNVGTLRRSIAERLRRHGLESAELDARVLLAHALGVEPSAVIACANETVSARALDLVESLVSRRLAGEPVARIVGRKEFWSRNFVLGPDALVPRPETETVVEAALAAFPDRDVELSVLDLGTGSGALLAAILLERPYACGVGIDRNANTLAVARTNFAALGLLPRASVICADWAAPLGAKFDLVVANPPYVPTHELARLPLEVRDHDPMLALDGGARGLSAYDAMVAGLPRLLAAGGAAVLELGQGQEAAVAEVARAYRLVVDGPARRDLSGRARALVLRSGG